MDLKQQYENFKPTTIGELWSQQKAMDEIRNCNPKNSLENLVGRRFPALEDLKKEIEHETGKKVNSIVESESERLEDIDNMIDFEFELFHIHTIYYLKDNAGNYFITEV